ncbi:hypothetical protein [Staphylococcus intermedius]|uniref:hypothetical protein n=1 Tax=Staphylococcus intermedius TaxID=1285 RepID=UPI001155140A|nr:hypothetical protein [Staphylococcus intermedius]
MEVEDERKQNFHSLFQGPIPRECRKVLAILGDLNIEATYPNMILIGEMARVLDRAALSEALNRFNSLY